VRREAAFSEPEEDYPNPELVVVDDGWPLAPIGRQRLARCGPIPAAKR
jgi:hypothetical protein